jgi:hypothetical protein
MNSQKFLRDTAVVPRSGWVYKDEDTKKVITAGSFMELIKNAVQHRKKNDLEVDAKIVDKIHSYLCDNNPPDFCAEGYRGLGDVVHAVAQPIAGLIDATFGTNVRGCWTCAGRREALNKAVGFRH